jgi:hypothetical protein
MISMPVARGNDLNIGNIVGTDTPLRFPKSARDKHLYVCGATGTGKSKFLEHLIRQDIRGWFKSKSGMLLLDPHGSLFDSVMNWLAKAGTTTLPIIPIDLRQDDWVISYNAIRRRSLSDCSVIVDNFVQAMAHVWGESGTDKTPRFARWAANILRTLYENDMTLLESEYLLHHSDHEARRALMKKLVDRASRRDWQYANDLKPREFEAELGSTANRLHRFLNNARMRSIFGHSRVSLDLKKALEEGHIILVSLATSGAKVSEENADLFATLLLSDLWTAALERGKKPNVKPFYVYLDEAQRFITPTIARNLDEARGFGLHLTLANQFPQQFLDSGEHGTKLFHSIMENASSKVVFRLHSEENLRPLAQWLFRGEMNPDEVKLSLDSTKVLGYDEVQRTSVTRGRSAFSTTTEGESRGETNTNTAGTSGSAGDTVTFEEDYLGLEYEFEDRVRSRSQGSAHAESQSLAESSQRSFARSEGETTSHSETVSSMLIPILGKEVSSVQFRSLEEQLHRGMAALFEQGQRQGIVRLAGMKTPVSIHTPTVSEPPIAPAHMKRYVAKLLSKWDFALPASEASVELADRTDRIEKELRQPNRSEEPETYRRRIDA